MRRLCISIFFIFFILLTACSSVTVPQVGAPVPCQIHSVEQVEQAILAGLSKQHWEVTDAVDHLIEARKTKTPMQAIVHIAYGYRGFSIEYYSSKNMDYDLEKDTIDDAYEKWVYRLMHTIEDVLKQEVEQLPPIKCSSLKDQYQQQKEE